MVGWKYAPFTCRSIVTAAPDHYLPPFVEQLVERGAVIIRLARPVDIRAYGNL